MEQAAHDKVKELEDEILNLNERKAHLDQSLAEIESTIFRLETKYLQQSSKGNILNGYETSTVRPPRKRRDFEDGRLFTRSSATFSSSLDVLNMDEEELLASTVKELEDSK